MAKLFTDVQIKRGRRSRLPNNGLPGETFLTTDEQLLYTYINGEKVNLLDNNKLVIDGGNEDINPNDNDIVEVYDNGTF